MFPILMRCLLLMLLSFYQSSAHTNIPIYEGRVGPYSRIQSAVPCESPPAACYVDDPSRNAQASDFIFHPLIAWSRPRSRPTCDPVFSLAAFRIRSAGCSIEASMVQFIICHSHVGRHRPEIRPRHVIYPRQSQAVASDVVERHFFD